MPSSLSPMTFFKCLADKTRLQCLMLINHEGELCVCELMNALGESQPKISRHLAQLRTAGILSGRRQRQWVFYQLNPALPPWAKTVLSETHSAQSEFIAQALNQLRAMGQRPDRLAACC